VHEAKDLKPATPGGKTETAIFLGRQPILDRQQRIVAYELLFRNGARNGATVTDHALATATVVANAFGEFGLVDALGHCRGFINVDADFLFSDVIELLPPDKVVLEILETVRVTQELVGRCRELHARGFSLALDDIVDLGDEYHDLLELIEVVKVELPALNRSQLERFVRHCKPLGLTLLAEKIDTPEQAKQCLDLGFDLFQGYYFARPAVLRGKKVDSSRLGMMRLLNLVIGDADGSELEAVFKGEPALSLNLLRLTNSVGNSPGVRITSLRHAITVLGQRPLQRWLQLLLFARPDTGTANPLLVLAATRGRLMELMGGRLRPRDTGFADRAFMTGILSLTPALFEADIVTVISPLNLPPEVLGALLEKTGELGCLLDLTEQLERGNFDGTYADLTILPALNIGILNHCQAEALAWANRLADNV
jgi:EAL and modified HD-GYP domain-containing signal transduction protein